MARPPSTPLIPSDVVRRQVQLPDSGVKIALQDWGGEGPLALLHHANGFCAALWAPVAEALRDRYRVVAMDARGHGDSPLPPTGAVPEAFSWSAMADDLQAVALKLLEETGQTEIGLGLGHSFGGTLTLAAEARRPGLYKTIVLADPVIKPPKPLEPSQFAERGTELVERARGRRQLWPDRASAREHLASRSLFATWTERALDLYVGEAIFERSDGQVELKCPGEVEALVFEGSFSLNAFELAAHIQTPVLFVRAQQGNFPRLVYESLIDGMANAKIVDVDAGHLIPMEQHELLLKELFSFVDSLT